ncbi:hypothetical protein HAX54_022480 [Datura stramonium]|uniref:Uncharacterized protein n=1 Tax=Datura stramonium TaxID=4076 RepID=A0ABS8UUI0_DATST|nr:hypothetical protein [Datura stramonium]
MITSGVEDEEKWLAAGISGLQQNAFYMHRALDSNTQHTETSPQMLSEPGTSKASYKYYELYMRAFDELRKLEIFFREESKACSVVELYELSSMLAIFCPDLLLDGQLEQEVVASIADSCPGMLRYQVQLVSDLCYRFFVWIRDADTVMDAVELQLQNFTEMNKLWVLTTSGWLKCSGMLDLHGKRKNVRKKGERSEASDLVVNCKDEIAQAYLMDCIIQVFPDEYHLQTLETLLGACPQFQVLPEFFQVEAFAKLNSAIGKVIEAQEDMPIAGAVTLYSSLLTFTLHVHPDRLDYVDQILHVPGKLSGRESSKTTKQQNRLWPY